MYHNRATDTPFTGLGFDTEIGENGVRLNSETPTSPLH